MQYINSNKKKTGQSDCETCDIENQISAMLLHVADGINKKTPQHNLKYWCSNHVKDMIKTKLMQ
jgi:hypothetical protein